MPLLFRSTLLMLLAALLMPGVTTAQEPPPGCDPVVLAEQFAAIQDHMAQAEALLTDNDTAGALEAFDAAASLVDGVRASAAPTPRRPCRSGFLRRCAVYGLPAVLRAVRWRAGSRWFPQ